MKHSLYSLSLLSALVAACSSAPPPQAEVEAEGPTPSMRVRTWTFDGAGGAQAIEATMESELEALSACQSHLRRGQVITPGDARQKIKFEVVDGRVENLQVPLPDKDVALCLEKDLRQWHLPQHLHGRVELLVFY